MANFGNTRMEKRKNPHETKSEPPKKALKKNELLIQHKALEKKCEALEKKCEALKNENKFLSDAEEFFFESIHLLEETVNLLELNIRKSEVEKMDNAPKTVEKDTKGVQTEAQEIMRCNECEYPAEDIYDLGEHMYEVHVLDSYDGSITCYYCGENFATKQKLMMHRKEAHIEKVKPCRFFSNGKCDIGDEKCWFAHDISQSKQEQVVAEFECNICGEHFKTRFDFMLHRKKLHTQMVPLCKNANSETCHFGAGKCWFIHSEIENKNKIEMAEENRNDNEIEMTEENENEMGIEMTEESKTRNDMIAKLFNMMEMFTQRIIQIENKI